MANLNDISLRQLEYAVAVAETLGFHKAAARCHVSQPTLSAQVLKLEDVLGVKLFERDRRRVLVTATGRELVERARRVLVEAGDLLGASARAREPFTGTLRIGVIPTVAPYLLPEITPAVRRAYPKLALVFREEKTADVVRELAEGTLDAGLLALEAEVGPLARVEITRDPFVAALPRGHALARKKRLTLSDLGREPVLLLDEGHCFRDQALAICAKARARETDLRATSLATLAQMVSSGAGVTLLPAIAVPVENRRAQLEVRPFADPVPGRTIALVWRPRSPLAGMLTQLAKTIRSGCTSSSSRTPRAPGRPRASPPR